MYCVGIKNYIMKLFGIKIENGLDLFLVIIGAILTANALIWIIKFTMKNFVLPATPSVFDIAGVFVIFTYIGLLTAKLLHSIKFK
jgi:hypothetical protein